MSKYRLEVYKGRGKQPWRWRVRARNGKLVACSGEGFRSRRNAMKSWSKFWHMESVSLSP
jgi:uncharacterized protein YegP (UPF0339 family)